MAHLTDSVSLEYLARDGLDPTLLPTEALRPVYEFALRYFFEGGRVQAPSEEAIRVEFGDVLDDNEVALGDPADTIAWAIEDLKGSWLYAYIGTFNKDFSQQMAKSQAAERPAVVADFTRRLANVSITLERADSSVDMREGMDERLHAYEGREADQGRTYGIRFGIEDVDGYTGGIHPGELAVLAGGPKAGKSLWMAMVALREWEEGRTPVLFTLENSVEMTLDRIACLATNVSLARWSRGQCTPEEKIRMRDWVRDAVRGNDHPLWILQPEIGQRSMEAMVRSAQLHGADSLLIDQLTFVELPDPRKPKHERIGDALHTLKAMISTGRDRLPCLLAHQISREGVKAAIKVGYLEMFHMAESAEVERTADWVFGLYRDRVLVEYEQAKFQSLAARRAELVSWALTWGIDRGFVSADERILLGTAA